MSQPLDPVLGALAYWFTRFRGDDGSGCGSAVLPTPPFEVPNRGYSGYWMPPKD